MKSGNQHTTNNPFANKLIYHPSFVRSDLGKAHPKLSGLVRPLGDEYDKIRFEVSTVVILYFTTKLAVDPVIFQNSVKI